MVNIQTQAQGSDSTFTAVEVGGPGTVGSMSRSLLWETIGSTEFYWGEKSTYYLRFAASARVEAVHSSSAENSLGRFSYNSIGDLELNRPSEFDRVLFAPERKGGEASGFFSVADLWRATGMLRILYGARFEGNRFGVAPNLNQAALDPFGQRNDFVPNSMHVSPRIGTVRTLLLRMIPAAQPKAAARGQCHACQTISAVSSMSRLPRNR